MLYLDVYDLDYIIAVMGLNDQMNRPDEGTETVLRY